MLKGAKKKNKCSSIDVKDDYTYLSEHITNPYCYNYGEPVKKDNSEDFCKLKNRIDMQVFNKK